MMPSERIQRRLNQASKGPASRDVGVTQEGGPVDIMHIHGSGVILHHDRFR
jgi:hypothetical protein